MKDNSIDLNELFDQAKQQAPQIDATSALRSMRIGLSNASPVKHPWMNWMVYVGIGAVMIFGLVLWFTEQSNVEPIQAKSAIDTIAQKTNNLQGISHLKDSTATIPFSSEVIQESFNTTETTVVAVTPVNALMPNESVPQLQPVLQIETNEKASKVEPTLKTDSGEDDVYIFPKLTEEEIETNHKNKRQMLKDLSKRNDKVYAYIPSGSYVIAGDSVSVQSFYMRTTEITNLEYRTFLFDLLIQDRKSEFLKAKPNQAMWSEIENGSSTAMQDHYFSHEAFNNYPVVNVPFEGAKMYCRWLTMELNQVLEDKGKSTINDVRLPSSHEYRYAASSGGKHLPFPWPKPMESTHLPLANYDGKGAIVDTLVGPAHAEAYFDNEFGLRNISGNCAEWCVQITPEGILETMALGGGWMDELSTLEITSAPTLNSSYNGHPNVGFRVVLTHLSRSN